MHTDGPHRSRTARRQGSGAGMAGAGRQRATRSGLDGRQRCIGEVGADIARNGGARCLPVARSRRGRQRIRSVVAWPEAR